MKLTKMKMAIHHRNVMSPVVRAMIALIMVRVMYSMVNATHFRLKTVKNHADVGDGAPFQTGCVMWYAMQIVLRRAFVEQRDYVIKFTRRAQHLHRLVIMLRCAKNMEGVILKRMTRVPNVSLNPSSIVRPKTNVNTLASVITQV